MPDVHGIKDSSIQPRLNQNVADPTHASGKKANGKGSSWRNDVACCIDGNAASESGIGHGS
jgi:hypothetical protein